MKKVVAILLSLIFLLSGCAKQQNVGVQGVAVPSVDVHNEANLEKSIHNAIMEYNKDRYYKGMFACESHTILGTGSEVSDNSENTLTIYLIALYQEYNLVDDEVESVSGGCSPVALTFLENEDEYELLEYWEPRDGSYYSDDIRDKFPEDVQEKYWSADSASEVLKAENEQIALEFATKEIMP